MIVEERISRQTGRRVLLNDIASDRELEALDVGRPELLEDRWETICDEHGWVVSHRTRALARWHLADPLGWCEKCMEAHDAS